MFIVNEEKLCKYFKRPYIRKKSSQVALVVKNLPANAGDVKYMGLIPGLGRFPEEGMATWQPTPVFLPGEFQVQRSLAGCSPWGHGVRHN